jgi:hypothetical protein
VTPGILEGRERRPVGPSPCIRHRSSRKCRTRPSICKSRPRPQSIPPGSGQSPRQDGAARFPFWGRDRSPDVAAFTPAGRARDGHHYVADLERLGKYLMVINHGRLFPGACRLSTGFFRRFVRSCGARSVQRGRCNSRRLNGCRTVYPVPNTGSDRTPSLIAPTPVQNKDDCISKCVELALPTTDYGISFHRCMLACMSGGSSGFRRWDRHF